jgi:uroporphyrinogen-III decarboxylase
MERMRRRLKGEPVDRVPNFDIMMTFAAHYIGKPLREYYLDYRVLVDANLAMLEDFQLDIVQAISDPYRETHDLGGDILFEPDHMPLCPVAQLRDYDDIKSLKFVAPERPAQGTALVPRACGRRGADHGLGRGRAGGGGGRARHQRDYGGRVARTGVGGGTA